MKRINLKCLIILVDQNRCSLISGHQNYVVLSLSFKRYVMDISSMSMNEKKRFSYIILRTKSLNLYKFVLLMIALKKHLLMNYFLKIFIPHL